MKKFRIVLVFAGNRRQYEEWMNKNVPGWKTNIKGTFIYVSSYEKAFGFVDPMIIKVGTWYEHDWINKALERYENMNKELA